MMNIKVLGPGCMNCINLEKLCKEVIAENGIDAEIQKITDFKDIISHGIISTPGLIINGKIVSSGKLPTKSTITHWIMNAMVEAENNLS